MATKRSFQRYRLTALAHRLHREGRLVQRHPLPNRKPRVGDAVRRAAQPAPLRLPPLLSEWVFVPVDWEIDDRLTGYWADVPSPADAPPEVIERLKACTEPVRTFAAGLDEKGSFAFARVDPSPERLRLVVYWGIT